MTAQEPNSPNKVDEISRPFTLEVGNSYEVDEPHFVFANGFETTVKIIEMQVDPGTARKRYRSKEDFWYDEDGNCISPRDLEAVDFYRLVRQVQKTK